MIKEIKINGDNYTNIFEINSIIDLINILINCCKQNFNIKSFVTDFSETLYAYEVDNKFIISNKLPTNSMTLDLKVFKTK